MLFICSQNYEKLLYKILAKTLFLGKELVYMPSCHSTNDMALQRINKPDTREGVIFITDNQTQGKGQRGNQWKSETNSNLTFSIVVKPSFLNASDQFYLNIIASLAVQSVLEKHIEGHIVKVKWPNDILLNNRKITGILIENTLNGNFIQWSVLGFGLNVNQKSIEFAKATSIYQETQTTSDLQLILEDLIGALELYYLKLKSGKKDDLKSEYLQHLFGYRELRKYRSEYEFEGEVEDITASGKLILRTNKGLQQFDFKEVEFLY